MFTLIDLPYMSLAPVVSDQTLSFHHGKHLQAYVDNLNKLIAGTAFEGKSLEEIIVLSSGAKAGAEKVPAVFNNAGQILNHALYFLQFAPGGSTPAGSLAAQIEKQWGSLEAFQAAFEAKGVGLFGSGWVWLQADAAGELSIAQYAGADNPVAHGLKPLLTFDVWEHAYYLDYQNRHAAHLHELWKIVDWGVIDARYVR